jgi:hypothetical protein
MGVGLGKGPLSPVLFVLAIDPLAQILENASRIGLLHNLRGRCTIVCTSLYADDAAISVAPIKQDLQNLVVILHRFGIATGLCTNFNKSSVVPIRCGNIDLTMCLRVFQQPVPPFRCDILAFLSRFGAFGEAIFSILRTNVLTSF